MTKTFIDNFTGKLLSYQLIISYEPSISV